MQYAALHSKLAEAADQLRGLLQARQKGAPSAPSSSAHWQGSHSGPSEALTAETPLSLSLSDSLSFSLLCSFSPEVVHHTLWGTARAEAHSSAFEERLRICEAP